MQLTPTELETLTEALLDTFPSRSALAQMVSYQFGASLDNISGSATDPYTTVHELVWWAEKTGNTAALVLATQQWTQSSAMSKWMSSLPRSTRQDERTIPASSPKPTAALRRAFVESLLLIPGIEKFEIRSALLVGIPWQASLSRGLEDVRSDLETMVDQLSALGQLKSGAWPLLILADNARAYAMGSEAEVRLEKVYKKLLTFYQAK
jgi:hypothetical protein